MNLYRKTIVMICCMSGVISVTMRDLLIPYHLKYYSCKIHDPGPPHVRCLCMVGFRQCSRQGAH